MAIRPGVSSIDDPTLALEAQLEAERRDIPMRNMLISILRIIPSGLLGPASLPVDVAKALIDKTESDLIDLTIKTIKEELAFLKEKVGDRDPGSEHKDWAEANLPPLIADACQKARSAQFQNRVERIARILVHAIHLGPDRLADETDELMRIAMGLTDRDVEVLGELVQHQAASLSAQTGRADHNSVNRYWGGADGQGRTQGKTMPAVNLGITEGDLQTACAKLQSFGLVVQIERNETFVRPGVAPFSILQRAVDFVEAIKSFAPTDPDEIPL